MSGKEVAKPMRLDKETMNMVRFAEPVPKGQEAIGKLYISQRAWLDLGSPQEITVTLTPAQS